MTTPTKKQLETIDRINAYTQKKIEEFKANIKHEKSKIALHIEQRTGKKIDPEKLTDADIDKIITDFEDQKFNELMDKFDDKLI